jgi:hypothetical protein
MIIRTWIAFVFILFSNNIVLAQCNLSATILLKAISCHEGNDGMASVNVTGGHSPYSYFWSNGYGTLPETPPILSKGTYTCTISDSMGCSIVKTAVLDDPESIEILFSTKNPQCGESDGRILANGSGGTGELSYFWPYNGSSDVNLINIPEGKYTCVVQDMNYCSAVFNSSLISENGPEIVSVSITSPNCYNGTGSAFPIVSGGNQPYHFNWSNSLSRISESENLVEVPSDIYYLKVTDNSGCSVLDTVVLKTQNPIKAIVETRNTICGMFQGYATVSVSGGKLPYTY